jgi:DNA-binding NarL/FixJ family response regulator
MIKILITDDHSAIRNGVKQILSQEFPGAEYGEAENAAAALKKIASQKWDVHILDMDMPGRSGLDVLKYMKDEKINLPTLIFSLHPEEQMAVRALKLGARGYLSKNAADTELTRAVTHVLSGRKYITPEVADKLLDELENPEDKAPHELLSDREYQTLLLIGAGKTISQIANEIALSVPTVSTYRARILEKMGMKTNAELVNYAIRNNLV